MLPGPESTSDDVQSGLTLYVPVSVTARETTPLKLIV